MVEESIHKYQLGQLKPDRKLNC